MKKDPLEFSLFCSDSLNMNYTKFSFIGLVKLNIERPFFWGTNPSFLRFVKHMNLDLSEGWAISSVCYPLWTRKNKKRHSSIMMGKLRVGNQFILQINGSFSLPLNMALVYISFSQLGIQMDCKSIHFHESCNSFESSQKNAMSSVILCISLV